MTRESAIESAERYFDAGTLRDDLARFVSFRTESQTPENRPQLALYLEHEIAPAFQRIGYEIEIQPNPVAFGGPVLVATRHEDDDLPTVLSYGHGDVIRGLEGQWRQGLDPWTLTVEGERWYGRGTADNKSQHLINMVALQLVITERGRLGFNSTFMVEMSEEIGSPGLPEFCAEHKDMLAADLLIGSDGPRLAPDRPTIFGGTRGALNFDLTVDLRAGGHHSGNWGGILANPGVILANAIASIINAQGRVLARDILPPRISNSVRAALADCIIDVGMDGLEIDAWWGEPGLSVAEKVFAWNTFEVLAFGTGNPDNPVSAVPPKASAHCQIRFTVDVPWQTFLPSLAQASRHARIPRCDNCAVGKRDDGDAARSGSSRSRVGFGIDRAHHGEEADALAQSRRLAAKRMLHRNAWHANGMGAAFICIMFAARTQRARARAPHA